MYECFLVADMFKQSKEQLVKETYSPLVAKSDLETSLEERVLCKHKGQSN